VAVEYFQYLECLTKIVSNDGEGGSGLRLGEAGIVETVQPHSMIYHEGQRKAYYYTDKVDK
jgi:hypothetical protein